LSEALPKTLLPNPLSKAYREPQPPFASGSRLTGASQTRNPNLPAAPRCLLPALSKGTPTKAWSMGARMTRLGSSEALANRSV